MFTNLAIGTGLIVITVVIHLVAMQFTRELAHSHARRVQQDLKTFPALQVTAVILLMFVALFLQVFIWAVVYLLLGAMAGMEQSLYFSMVTFTTLGYGDLVLPAQWSLLSAIEATNGIIMFGWTTAIVIAIVQRVYFSSIDTANADPGNSG